MIIERKDTKKQIEFRKLDIGQFFDCNGQVYIKFKRVGAVGTVNAFNCDKNLIVDFMSDTMVTPLNGKVVIE